MIVILIWVDDLIIACESEKNMLSDVKNMLI